MPILEGKLEKKVRLYSEALGVVQLKLNVQGRRGWPDRLFLYKGRVLFIEFKRKGEAPRKLQLYIHDLLALQGFVVEVIDDENEGFAAIDRLRAGPPARA